MRFETPWALALLVAVPLVVVLWRRRTAEVVRVASVLPFRADPGAPEEVSARRRIDVVLVLTVLSIAGLALAAAGPSGPRAPEEVLLLADRSASTEALDDRGVAVGASARERARRLVAEEAPGAVIVERDLDPARLAEALAALRAEGRPGAVVATDGAIPEVPGFVVVGPDRPAGPNAALTNAALDGAEAVVAVTNFGPDALEAGVSDGTTERRVAVAAGGTAEVRFPAPPPGAKARYALRDGGSLARDDALDVVRRGGVARVRVESVRPVPRLERALRAATSGDGAAGTSEVVVRYGGRLRRESVPVLHVAPDGADADAPVSVVARSGPGEAERTAVDASRLAGTGPLATALPRPSTTLAATRGFAGGDPFLVADDLVLGAKAPGLVALAVDPEASPDGASPDPWFAVLVASALDHLAGGPDRLDVATRDPRSESDLPRTLPAEPAPGAVRACVRGRAGSTAGGTASPAAALAALGAACAAAAAWTGRRR